MNNYFKGYTQEEKKQFENDILEKIKKLNEEEISNLLYEYEEEQNKYFKKIDYYFKKCEELKQEKNENKFSEIYDEWTEAMKISEKLTIEYNVIYNYYYDNF